MVLALKKPDPILKSLEFKANKARKEAAREKAYQEDLDRWARLAKRPRERRHMKRIRPCEVSRGGRHPRTGDGGGGAAAEEHVA